jgi:pyruvate dehydrogenase E2 component (dihydrolipoamide acetyltransferase)
MSEIYPIAIPKWGIEMVEGTINNWLKQPGDAVVKGEEIVEIESDKIINAWDAPADGILRRQLVEEGEVRAVGQLLGIIAGADVDEASIDAFIENFANKDNAEKPASAPATAETSTPTAAPVIGGAAGKRSNPVVRRLAEELGVNLETISGTGRNGRITQDDVRAAAGQDGDGSSAAAAPADYEVLPFSATRKTIAQRLSKAKQDIPHYYLSVNWEIDGMMSYRKSLNESSDVKVSLNDLIVYCVGRALLAEPRVNINVVDNNIHQYRSANVSVAIATDDGLFPVTLRAVENMTPQDIARAVADLAQRAKAGNLNKADLSDGSFTVSNLGMYDIDNFTAIINPPMGAILALGSASEKAVVKDGVVTVATVLNATLSCDHRAIDGAIGASFLAALKKELDQLGR